MKITRILSQISFKNNNVNEIKVPETNAEYQQVIKELEGKDTFEKIDRKEDPAEKYRREKEENAKRFQERIKEPQKFSKEK